MLSGASLPVEVVRKQIGSAIDIMIHLSRIRDRSRRVTEIHEVIGVIDGDIRLNPLFRFEESGETPEGKVIGKLIYTGNSLEHQHKLQMAGKSIPLWARTEGAVAGCY